MFGIRRSIRWLGTKITTKLTHLLLRILASGPVPQHIAFIMDGNRRYARINDKPIPEGHGDGFMALRKMLEICLRLNVRCVSAYAFAMDNFKRSPGEVEALMALAEEKLLELCKHGDLLEEYGVRLNIIGRTELLPPEVQAAIKQAESLSRRNNRSILNLCMPYSSRDEITTAVESAVRTTLASDIKNKLITEEDINAHLATTLAGSPPIDILVRTSGVKRLSDFMLWQCCNDVQLQFVSTYWPDMGLWDFIPIILDFQRKKWANAT